MESKNVAFYSTLCVEGTCTGIVIKYNYVSLFGEALALEFIPRHLVAPVTGPSLVASPASPP